MTDKATEVAKRPEGLGKSRRFKQVDVFTAVPYLGNPVAVVLEAEGLTFEEMQRVARWTNLSETTFVMPARTTEADYRVRIFTTTQELPFAGHPTLGTCHAWLQNGGVPQDSRAIVQECEAGLVRVRPAAGRLEFEAPPLRREGAVEDDIAAEVIWALEVNGHDVVDMAWADNGSHWIGVLMGSATAVLALTPRYTSLKIGVAGPFPSGSPQAFEVRAFFPKDGSVAEDPVTGSFNASLAQWLLGSGRAQAPYIARQGTALGRDGHVYITKDPDGSIWVGGHSVTCVNGKIEV